LGLRDGTTENVPFDKTIEVYEMTAKKTNSGSGKIHLKWVRSAICAPVKQKRVIKGLGFTRLNQVIERPDTNAIRGMVAKVPHLVEFVE
jgi:large subunit ribosomal protein L30